MLLLAPLVSAQFAPPGLIHSLDFDDAADVPLAIPFLPADADPADAFAGQLDNSGLTLHQWDADTQSWRTATFTPGTGWSGDVIPLNPGEPVLVSATVAAATPYRLSLTGLLPDANLTRSMLPGLNLVGSPRPRALPLTSWDWDLLGESAAAAENADTLYTLGNDPQAWLNFDGTDAVWTGFAVPADPGLLLPGHAYFYLFRGAQSFQAEGEVADEFDAQVLPAVTAVSYDAANDRVLVTVETAGGASNTLDLFYQDADLTEGFDPQAPWQVWALGLSAGSGDTFLFEDDGDAAADPARAHPRDVAFRFYQVADATLDSSGDGFSDAYKSLVLGLDPNAFTPTPENAPHLIRQVWWDIPGLHVYQLTGSPAFPWHPDEEAALTPLFEAPVDIADYYGQRIFGRFLAPLTGYYQFRIASDNGGELWITVDGQPQKIAWVHGHTWSRQWFKFESQTSAPIWLEAGQRYPLEALGKSNAGGDNLAVAVVYPGGLLTEAPVPATRFVPAFDPALDPDSDGDGIPDSWELAHGLDPNDAADALADASGDGFTNLEAFLFGLDPNHFYPTPANVPELTRQLWWNVYGWGVHHVYNHPGYPFSPDQTLPLEGDRFTTPEYIADHYGQRVFGRFHAPLTGDYTFWMTVDDLGELWITVDNVRTRIIQTVTYNPPGAWTQTPEQRSVPITLEAGQAYELEAVMKEGIGRDYVAVGITLPDGRYERPMRTRRFLEAPAHADFHTDTSGNGLSDYEEWVVGTDPALADTSGDGISDYDAVVLNLDPLQQHPTPPIPAWWVLQHDIPTDVPYLHEDPDGDGLTNLEEYQQGTNPNIADNPAVKFNVFTPLR